VAALLAPSLLLPVAGTRVRTAALADADLDGIPDVHAEPVDPAAELLTPIGPKCHDLPFSGRPENGFVIPNACCHPKFHVPLRVPRTMPHCFTDSTGKKHYGVTMRQISQRFGLVNRSADHGRPEVDTEVWAYGPDCTETFEERIYKVKLAAAAQTGTGRVSLNQSSRLLTQPALTMACSPFARLCPPGCNVPSALRIPAFPSTAALIAT